MPVKGIIFDLDQTIVNSSIAEPHRKSRNWSNVYSLIPQFQLYNGFDLVFKRIKELMLPCCIVTSSPRVYTEKVVNHFRIPCNYIVDYFATSRRKPYPDPMYKALELLYLKPHEVISFGDRAMDIQSSNSANIKSIACTWGSNEKNELINANPSIIINTPSDILGILNQYN